MKELTPCFYGHGHYPTKAKFVSIAIISVLTKDDEHRNRMQSVDNSSVGAFTRRITSAQKRTSAGQS